VVHLVGLNFVITALGVLAYPVVLRRIMPTLRLRPVFNPKVLRQVLSFGIYSLLSKIAYLFTYQVDRIVTGILLGMASVTYYVVPFTLVTRLTSITIRIGGVIFPAISELQGLSQSEKINDLYLVSSRIILILNTCICLPLVIFGARFLTLWMGPDFGHKSGIVLVLITLGLYVSSFTNIPSFVADGLGLPKITGAASITNAIINVSILVPMTKLMGITGISIAFLVSNVAVAPAFVWYVNNRVLGIPLARLMREVYLRPLLASLVTALPFAFVPQENIGNLYLMIAVIASFSLGYLVVAYFMGAFPKQLEVSLIEYLRKKLGLPEASS
jgi:O-antigen/teichoic acid export membrane protein